MYFVFVYLDIYLEIQYFDTVFYRDLPTRIPLLLKERKGERDRQTDRQRVRERQRETERQRDRERQRETERQREFHSGTLYMKGLTSYDAN